MSRLRDAAAAWVEHGRWIGWSEAYRAVEARIAKLPPDYPASKLWTSGIDLEASAAAANAATARRDAERVMHALEHPGARLARRLVAAARAARHAWRVAR